MHASHPISYEHGKRAIHTWMKMWRCVSTLRALALAAERWIRACVAAVQRCLKLEEGVHWRTEVGPLEEIVPRTTLSCGPSIRAVQECPQHGIRWRRLCDHMLPRGMHVPSGRSMSARGVRAEPIGNTGQRRSVSWMHAARYGAASGVGAWRSSSSRRREARSYMCQKQARYAARQRNPNELIGRGAPGCPGAERGLPRGSCACGLSQRFRHGRVPGSALARRAATQW